MRLLTVIILFVIILFGSSCNNMDNESFAYGNFESDDIIISSESSGRILELKFDQGDHINLEELIAVTDTVQLDLKRRQILSNIKAVSTKLTQINSQIEIYEVNISNLEREQKRFGSLFLENASTKKQLDDIDGQIEVVRAQISALESQKSSVYAEIESLKIQMLQIEDQLSKCYLHSPASGVVLEKYVNSGELATPGKRILKVADLSEIILRAYIDGNQLSSIAVGDKVAVLYDAENGIKETNGKVTWIASEAEFTPKIIQTREERTSLVYAIKVNVENNGELKIGMPGEIKLLENAGDSNQ